MAKLSRTKVKNAISGSHGIISDVARKCGVTHAAIYFYLYKLKKNNDTELHDMIEIERDSILDIAESALISHIKNGDLSALKYILSTKGRTRGYITKSETEENKIDIDLSKCSKEQLRRLIAGERPAVIAMELKILNK